VNFKIFGWTLKLNSNCFRDIFSLGFGPFRWVCSSGDYEDLKVTDQIAIELLDKLINSTESELVREQYRNNLEWVQNADGHNLVVGSQARILYSDLRGRIGLASAFNTAVSQGKLKVNISSYESTPVHKSFIHPSIWS